VLSSSPESITNYGMWDDEVKDSVPIDFHDQIRNVFEESEEQEEMAALNELLECSPGGA